MERMERLCPVFLPVLFVNTSIFHYRNCEHNGWPSSITVQYPILCTSCKSKNIGFTIINNEILIKADRKRQFW